MEHTCVDKDGNKLAPGRQRRDDGTYSECLTFVLVVNPREIMDVCFVDVPEEAGPEGCLISSDVRPLHMHPSPDLFEASHVYIFPLGGESSYLCSQGKGGAFTHFYAATFHAYDFECPVGTPVLAIGDGTVVQVQQSKNGGGIHCDLLYLWNSLMLKLDDGMFVEYVHISPGSVKFGMLIFKNMFT